MAARKVIPSQARIKELLTYDPETGQMKWLARRGPISAGSRAGASAGRGYLQIQVDGTNYRYHRLVWLYMTGEWPNAYIDHINRDPTDNRWANLRLATHTENLVNSRQRKSKSGFRGVFPMGKRFRAFIKLDGRAKYLGTFDTPEEASAVYLQEARRLYGEFFPG